jgi:hypothetical protein
LIEGAASPFTSFAKTMLKHLLLISLLFGSVNNLNDDSSGFVNQIYTLPTAKIAKKHFVGHKKINYTMNKILVTQPLTLQIWENDPNFPAPGTPPGTDIPVGFASLSFTLENKTQHSILIKLLAVEVRSISNKKLLMSMPAKDLILHPLEIAPQRYQLSNKNGYGNINQVEAIVIYELDGQQYTLESSPVKISHS